MSKRNLAGTIIEGGRAGYSKWERRARNRILRRQGRIDRQGDYDDRLPETTKLESYRYAEISFADKLRPLDRWLHMQVGRPFSEVWSELCRRYDKRRLRNWHMLEHVRAELGLKYYRHITWGLYIDADGIICWRSREEYEQIMQPTWEKARLKWLAENPPKGIDKPVQVVYDHPRMGKSKGIWYEE